MLERREFSDRLERTLAVDKLGHAFVLDGDLLKLTPPGLWLLPTLVQTRLFATWPHVSILLVAEYVGWQGACVRSPSLANETG